MKISVLTPTYNRGYTLPYLYDSLIKNKMDCPDFEWLIMDDGSNDNTEVLVNGWIKENAINIRYFKQPNQGKMVALNNLLQYIKGDIEIECDSDDYFTDDCFRNVLEKWEEIKDDNTIYGLAFPRITKEGKIIGSPFKREGKVSRIFDMYFKDGVTGDKTLAFKSNIRKQFKHKLENGERFATEGRMYHEMDLQYKGLKCFNTPAVVCEYLGDGYTKNIIEVFKKNPYAHYYYYLEMFKFDFSGVPLKYRIHILKHYILFSYLTRQKKKQVIKNTTGLINKLLVIILIIPGYIKTRKKFGQ